MKSVLHESCTIDPKNSSRRSWVRFLVSFLFLFHTSSNFFSTYFSISFVLFARVEEDGHSIGFSCWEGEDPSTTRTCYDGVVVVGVAFLVRALFFLGLGVPSCWFEASPWGFSIEGRACIDDSMNVFFGASFLLFGVGFLALR